MSQPLFVERALFVVGPSGSGKSRQLRSMFIDPRFGTDSGIPTQKRLGEVYDLSLERHLYLRLTSPHEMDETPDDFLEKFAGKASSGRWCFAGASQLDAGGRMPDCVDTVRLFCGRFSPERTRVCFLSPDIGGQMLGMEQINRLAANLGGIPGAEYVFIDGGSERRNGLFLADFFDFT